MALTFSTVASWKGPKRGTKVNIVNVTFDNSYPTGGEAVSASDLGLSGITSVKIANHPLGHVAYLDSTNSKILVYYCDYDASADGALIQCANGYSSLSGLVATLEVLGY